MTDDHDEADGHSHPHAPIVEEGALSDYQAMEVAVRELLIDKGILTADQVRRQVENMDSRTPARGARVVATAWLNPDFRAQLLSDGNAAVEQLGLEHGPYKLIVVENTSQVHNVIVCTLCSCYPVSLLGPSPGWYKSFAYRSRTVREPRAVLGEFGVTLPDTVQISVWDSTSEARYMVLPLRPAGTGGLAAEELAALVTRNGLIGTALV